MKRMLHFVIMLSTLLSCGGKSNESDPNCQEEIKIDLTSKEHISEENVIDTIALLPLSNEKTFLNQIGKIEIVDHIVYVSDNKAHNISFFSIRTGEYLGGIHANGRGAGEYSRIDDFYVDGTNGFIEILDGALRKILRFDLNGKYLEDSDLPYAFSSFTRYGEQLVLAKDIAPTLPEMMYQLMTVDENRNIKNRFVKVEENRSIDMVFAPKLPIQVFQGTLNFQPIYSPTIYSLDQNFNLAPKFCLNFLDKWPEDALLYNRKNLQPFEFMESIFKSGKVYFVNFQEGSNHVLVQFNINGENEPYLNVYNKTTRKSSLVKTGPSSLYFGNESLFAFGDFFVSIKQPYELKEHFMATPEKIRANMKSVIENLEVEDNPVLVFVKFKQ